MVLIAFGFILMAGGGSEDPKFFNPEIFNFRRIRLAPTIVLMGFDYNLRHINAPKKKVNECA